MTALPRVTVFGMGYLGITHAACMASQGFQVLGVDTDCAKIARLSAAEVPVFEPGLENLLRDGLDSGRLRFTTSYELAASFGDVHFICVGTPQQRGGNGADLAQLDACIAGLAPRLTRPCLVAGKSTTPAGTAAMIAETVAHLAPVGRSAEVCWNPEFLREGHAIEDTLAPSRIVVGVTSERGEAVMRVIYARQLAAGVPLYVTDLHTAELAKATANAFLATKISFINAVAEACEHAGADIRVLAGILGSDPRIGAAMLNPGLGFGGGCLPKDIRALKTSARQLGAGGLARLLGVVDAINLRRRASVVSLACEVAGGSLVGAAVCVLGAAFKPGSDDVRDSPALDVARMLRAIGARVTVYDPAALDNARIACPELLYAGSVREAAKEAQVVLALTDWPEFGGIDPAELAEVCGTRRGVIDARHVLDPERWRAAGWDYRAPGVPAAPMPSAGNAHVLLAGNPPVAAGR